MLGDGGDEIALGDLNVNDLFLGPSPDGTPGAQEIALDGSTPAFGDLSLLPFSDDSGPNLFSTVPQLEQNAGLDLAFLPSPETEFTSFLPVSGQDSNDLFAFNPGLGNVGNVDGGPNDGLFASLSSQDTGLFQDWTK